MIPLLLCDDSNMARKQLIRALPAEWPVSLSQASNGEEALALIRQGLGQVMLLDLTMPVLDGYQTLTVLRAEGLKSQVIVVSGDVQEEAVRRVRELAALAFIKKPADPEILRQTLIDLKLFAPQATPAAQAQAAALAELKVSFCDALREVSNVAMSRAAALLAKVLGVFVQLPVPQVNIFEVSELHMTLLDAQRGERFSAICQGFIGEAIAGEALLLFHDSEVNDMARLLGWQPKNEAETSEMLLDLASILIGACLAGIAEQLDLLLLFTEDSIKRLTAKIGYLME